MDGEITVQQFDKSHLQNPKLLELVNKVTVSEKKEYTQIYGKSFPNKVLVRLVDGEGERRAPRETTGRRYR